MPNYEKQCKELLLDDVVEIAVFEDADIEWSHPKCIRVIETNIALPIPAFVLSMREGDHIYLSDTPVMEIETETKVYGKSYQYKLTATSLYNIKDMDEDVSAVEGKDVAFMLTRYNGTKEIVCPLKDSSDIKYKVSGENPAKGSIEITCQSRSPLITIKR